MRQRSRSRQFAFLTLIALLTATFTLYIAYAPAGENAKSATDATQQQPAPIDFNADIRPIFNHHCLACHGGVKQAAGLSFIRRATALQPAESGEIAIVPGGPEHSELIRRITADDDERMPPADHGRRLTEQQISTLRRWIGEGALWREHWAYVKPEPQPAPQVRDAAWCRQPLDRFVLSRLEGAGLSPAPEADRRSWLRRVTFDLIGLPPTIDELQAFLDDDSPSAWEKVVDRLLASRAYGERQAAVWLDLARYSDTVGFERDPPRNIWPYRDWLIRALNDDMPFDQFTIKQLAGDLLERPTLDDLIATGFHRNTQNNTEGGTDDEEFRLQAVIDRVNTTWQVWQGTTFGCTQCHSHPYAPFDNDEYYKFMAFFNTTRDCDVDEDYPLMYVPLNDKERDRGHKIDNSISALRKSLFARFSQAASAQGLWKNLPVDVVSSTGSAKLRTRTVEGAVEVLAEGTISTKPVYTIEAPVPDGIRRLSALRIEVLPMDLEAALRTPESGFILSHLQCFIISPQDEEPRAITFELAMADEAEPLFDPHDSLQKDDSGWAAYTRIAQPRSAVFVPASPVELSPGDRLQFTLAQNSIDKSLSALVMRRFKLAVSDSERWQQLVSEQEFRAERQQLAELREQREKIGHVAMPVMQELPEETVRHTYRFERGNWLAKGAEVHANTPALLPPLAEGAPHNRLALAAWLVSPDNPLTARVTVNRLWAELFGVGLVETAEDFGPAGTPAENQPLLDHLACRFGTDLQWSTKRLLREIVLSATYRQDSKGSAELRQRDPANRMLARGPRNRLSAEMVRDQALATSGLLTSTMYGPPVMPPQPEGVWRTVYNGRKWKVAEGPDRYRRGLYTYWKRTSGYPSFMAFDSPSREVCTARRIVTNTPLQALATLNDEAYVECAAALGRRMLSEGTSRLNNQITWAYTAVTSHEPSTETIDDLATLYNEALATYEQDTTQTTKMGQTPEEAARAVVGNAILNLDSALIK